MASEAEGLPEWAGEVWRVPCEFGGSCAQGLSHTGAHHLLVGRVASARGPLDSFGRGKYPGLDGTEEGRGVPCPAVSLEEEVGTSGPLVEGGEARGLDHGTSMQRNPAERGRRRPLRAAVTVMTLASVVCAWSPTIG